MEVHLLGSLKSFTIPQSKFGVRQKPDSKGIRLGHRVSDSPWGYPTRGRESRALLDHQEAQESTTPMGRR